MKSFILSSRTKAIVIFIFVINNMVKANSSLKDAFQCFKRNDYKKAAELYKEADKSSENADEAYSMLVLIPHYNFDQKEC